MLEQDMTRDAEALLGGRADQAGPTRRTALKAALGAGYAAAAAPLMAQTAIRTSSDGLTVGEVMIDVAGFKMPAYRAAPAGKTGLPVVLVLSEIFGVHEYIADTARRFARRATWPSRPSCSCARAMPRATARWPSSSRRSSARCPTPR